MKLANFLNFIGWGLHLYLVNEDYNHLECVGYLDYNHVCSLGIKNIVFTDLFWPIAFQ